MTKRLTFSRALVLAAIGLGIFGVAACDPADPAVQGFMAWAQQENTTIAARTAGGPSDAALARLRACESGGNYRAVNRSGTYRGAYQFSRQTWSGVARGFLPSYAGTDPASAPPHIQDAMARVLWKRSGPGQWPVCGRRAGS